MDTVRSIRKERGWSQQRLAAEADINKVTLVHIETGKSSPNVETLQKLAGALGVELGDFFPKVQAPLPLEFRVSAGLPTHAEAGVPANEGHEELVSLVASFVDAWASYVSKRARGWEETLPKGARGLKIFSPSSGRPPEGVPGLVEELQAEPKLAFEILRRSEMALSELAALLEVLAITSGTTRNSGAWGLEKSETLRVTMVLTDHTAAGLLVMDSLDKWSISEQVARDVVSNEAEVTEELAQAMERSRRAAEEQQKVVALFKERQSA